MPTFTTTLPTILLSLTTAATVSFPTNEPDLFILDTEYKYSSTLEIFKPWEEQEKLLILSSEGISETIEKIKILQNFISELLETSEDLDPSYAKVINEHFWELL